MAETTNPEVTNQGAEAPKAPEAQSQETQTQQTQAPKPPPADITAFKALMDREKALRSREQKLAEVERELSQYKQLPQLAKERPLDALRAVGLDYEDLVKRVSKGERPDPVDPLRREMEELKATLQELRQREEETERMTHAQRAQAGLKEFVSSSEDFPLTKTLEASDMVFDYMQGKYQATGDWPSHEDATREVEAYLSGLVEKALSDERIRSKYLSPKKPTETPHISNQDVSQIATREAPGELSEADRVAMAVKVMEARMRERTQ